MSDKYTEAMGKSGAAILRKERRAARIDDNAALAGKEPLIASKQALGAPPRHWGSRDVTFPIPSRKERLMPWNAPKRPKKKRKAKSPSRKSLVKKADTAFSLHIRAMYPTSFFSGKPTECCFHIITRGKHSVRWVLDNAVGSTMGENYEMEFNPHKFINMLIESRGLPWYQNLIRRSNEIRKHTRADLEMIAARGYE